MKRYGTCSPNGRILSGAPEPELHQNQANVARVALCVYEHLSTRLQRRSISQCGAQSGFGCPNFTRLWAPMNNEAIFSGIFHKSVNCGESGPPFPPIFRCVKKCRRRKRKRMHGAAPQKEVKEPRTEPRSWWSSIRACAMCTWDPTHTHTKKKSMLLGLDVWPMHTQTSRQSNIMTEWRTETGMP